jgi:hypothetical protein
MTDQPLDLRTSLQVVPRHPAAVGILVVFGLLAGAAYTAVINPLLPESNALVALPPPSTTCRPRS